MKITALVQARLNSKRLPKKVLLPLGGKTVLECVVERVSKAKYIKEVVVVTSSEKSDDPIAKLCRHKKIKYFRGSLSDVLDRYYQASRSLGLENICRVTSDCPLIDPDIIDIAAKKYLEGKYDYVGINRPLGQETYPDGFDAEFFSFKPLEKAWKEASLKSEREHVTTYMWKNPKKFKIFSVKSPINLSQYRLTLDEPKDYELIKLIYEKVKPLQMTNIISFLEGNKNILEMNKNIQKNIGYIKSLQEDRSIKKSHG